MKLWQYISLDQLCSGRSILLAAFVCVLTVADASDWPQFRGPLGNGVAAEGRVPSAWSSTTNLAWKVPVPGSGWSQPIVVGQLVFVTSATSSQPLRPKLYSEGLSDLHTTSGSKASAPAVSVEWKVWALDLRNGAVRWDQVIASGHPQYPIHPSNTFASETPAADNRAVYVFFGSAGIVAALDHRGQFLWKRDLGRFRQQENYGTGSSLRLHDGLLFIQLFSEEQAFVLCLDTQDGKERWRVTREKPGSCWNTPLLWQTQTRTELVIYGQNLMTSHDPRTGDELWRAEGVPMPAMTSACADLHRLYFGCRDPYRGGPLHALSHPVERKLRLSDRIQSPCEAWMAPGGAPGMPSPVAAASCVFVINGSLLGCYDAATGKEHFKERMPGFHSVIASPIIVGENLVVVDESGLALSLATGPRFEILGRSKLEDIFWASPAVAEKALLLRGIDFLYCIRER